MQRPDEKKRQLILSTAAKMFAALPYHKVKLDDIAAAAKVGKGTVYIYFQNKEELYFSLLYDGFGQLVEGLREQLAEPQDGAPPLTALKALRRAVDEMTAFAFAHPHLFEMMRNVGEVKRLAVADWNARRQELIGLIAATIRRGVKSGDLDDPNPEMSAACIGGMVRSIRLFGPRGATERQVADQVFHILSTGIGKSTRARSKPARKRRLLEGATR